MVTYHEHGPQWMPQHALGKRVEVDISFLPDDEAYSPYSAEDAIATVRESGMFADYDGYVGQLEMITDEAKARYPHLFGSVSEANTEQSNDKEASVVKTNYIVSVEPSLFYAVRTHGSTSKEARRILESSDLQALADHELAIRKAIQKPYFARHLGNVAVARDTTKLLGQFLDERIFDGEFRLYEASELQASSYPVDPLAEVR